MLSSCNAGKKATSTKQIHRGTCAIAKPPLSMENRNGSRSQLCDGDLPNKILRQLHVEFMAKINDQNPGPSSLLADTPISLHLWKC